MPPKAADSGSRAVGAIALPDRRFGPIDAAVRSPLTRIVSVDVFDTLLWRNVPKPTDVFLLVGRRLADRGALAGHVDPRGFARLRLLAETEARRRRRDLDGSVEVGLAEIYEVFDRDVTPGLQMPDLVNVEVEIEQERTFPDPQLAGYLRLALGDAARPRGKSLRLIAVSDTYFSEEQVRSMLAGPPLAGLVFERVFTSSDARTGKGDGLWKAVVEGLAVEPAQIAHIGDNLESDVICAEREGIRALHLPVSTQRFALVETRERIVGPDGDPTRWVDEVTGDLGLTAARRRATFLGGPGDIGADASDRAEDRGADDEAEEDGEVVTWETGTAVLGPVLTGFAQWVHQQAEAIGADRALCLMREGWFLKQLVDEARPASGRRLHTETVWASREAVARASIYRGSEEELRSFLARRRPPTPSQLVASFGLSPSDIPALPELDERYARTDGDPAAGEELVEMVLERPGLVAQAVDASRARRRRLLDHVRAAAGPGPGPVVVVDVGWSGMIQESLQSMLREDGDNLQLHGLYLLNHVGAADRVLRGTKLRGFLGTFGNIAFEVAGITGNPELVELACMSRDGSLLEIGGDGTPVLAPPTAPEAEEARREVLQAGVRAFQKAWLGLVDDLSDDRPLALGTTPSSTAMLGRILGRFLSQPDRDETLAFMWWGHEENFGSDEIERLVPRHFVRTLRYRTAEELNWAPRDLYWVGGAAALVDHEMTDAVHAMREGRIDPSRFSSHSEAGAATVVIEGAPTRPGISGSPGADAPGVELERAVVPLRVNRRGLSIVEWRGVVPGARRVVITPAEHSALMRIDLIDVGHSMRGNDETTAFTWERGRARDALTIRGAQWVTEDALAVDAGSRLVIDLPTAPPAGAVLSVVVAGAYLPGRGTLVQSGPDAVAAGGLRAKVVALAADPKRIGPALRRRLRRPGP